MRISPTLVASLLASCLPAQQFTDTFGTDSSTPPPGWTVRAGSWSVSGQRLVTDGAALWSFLTKDGLRATNCAIDFDAFYGGPGLQFAGAAVRFTDPKDTLVCKIQESTVVTQDFETSYVYERPNTSSAKWVNKLLPSQVSSFATVRVVVYGNQVEMLHDFNLDGVFDYRIPFTTSIVRDGLVGVSVWGQASVDNFKFYNAVLRSDAGIRAKLGGTYPYDLYTTSPNKPWMMALSGGKAGFAFGGRMIPLTPDPIFDLSVMFGGSLGLAGTTDGNGFARVVLKLPNVLELEGTQLYAAAVTQDPLAPEGIDNISNEHSVRLVR